jgi:hypothetical protein
LARLAALIIESWFKYDSLEVGPPIPIASSANSTNGAFLIEHVRTMVREVHKLNGNFDNLWSNVIW